MENSGRDELKIIKKVREGSSQHFSQLFDHYHKKVYYAARKLNLSHEDSEEIVQEVFISIWEQRHKLRVDGSINGLLFTITKRLVIKRIKKIINARAYKDNHHQKGYSNVTEDYIIFSDLEAYTGKGINQLSPKRKQIFMLSKKQGLSNDEIAKKLNLSKRTVENQLYRATQEVKRHLKNDDLIILLLLCSVASVFG